MLKSLASLHEADARFHHIGLHDQAAGSIRPLQVGDLHNDMNAIEINASVPHEIRYQFDLARNAYLYAWYAYDFFVLAEEHTYVVLEMALRLRGRSDGLTRHRTLKPYLQLALKRGWIRSEDVIIPGGPASRPMSFIEELPRLRDRLHHGDLHLSPDLTLLVMRKCGGLLNRLFPETRTPEAA